jgi:hypothetical protein
MKLNLDKMRKDKVKLQRTIDEQIKYVFRLNFLYFILLFSAPI